MRLLWARVFLPTGREEHLSSVWLLANALKLPEASSHALDLVVHKMHKTDNWDVCSVFLPN